MRVGDVSGVLNPGERIGKDYGAGHRLAVGELLQINFAVKPDLLPGGILPRLVQQIEILRDLSLKANILSQGNNARGFLVHLFRRVPDRRCEIVSGVFAFDDRSRSLFAGDRTFHHSRRLVHLLGHSDGFTGPGAADLDLKALIVEMRFPKVCRLIAGHIGEGECREPVTIEIREPN